MRGQQWGLVAGIAAVFIAAAIALRVHFTPNTPHQDAPTSQAEGKTSRKIDEDDKLVPGLFAEYRSAAD